jgi:hypothetical protein
MVTSPPSYVVFDAAVGDLAFPSLCSLWLEWNLQRAGSDMIVVIVCVCVGCPMKLERSTCSSVVGSSECKAHSQASRLFPVHMNETTTTPTCRDIKVLWTLRRRTRRLIVLKGTMSSQSVNDNFTTCSLNFFFCLSCACAFLCGYLVAGSLFVYLFWSPMARRDGGCLSLTHTKTYFAVSRHSC